MREYRHGSVNIVDCTSLSFFVLALLTIATTGHDLFSIYRAFTELSQHGASLPWSPRQRWSPAFRSRCSMRARECRVRFGMRRRFSR